MCLILQVLEASWYNFFYLCFIAYTSLKLGSSHSPIIAPENVTFFTRLGSIGRGDFGGVWKGELCSNQGQVDVAIRQIPGEVLPTTPYKNNELKMTDMQIAFVHINVAWTNIMRACIYHK